MPYCTLADIEDTIPPQDLVELTDDDASQVVGEAAVNKAIAAAGEQIDAALRGRYGLPLTVAPGLVNTLATDIAVWRIYGRRSTLTIPEAVKDRYKSAEKTLAGIAKGDVVLDAAPAAAASAVTGGPSFVAPDRLFTRDSLQGF